MIWHQRKGDRILWFSCISVFFHSNDLKGLSKLLWFKDESFVQCCCSWAECDGETGISDTLVLNMDTLVWSVVATVKGRAAVASEVSIVSLELLVILCSFEIVLTPSWENCYCYSLVLYYCWTSPVSYDRSPCPGKVSWCHEIALFLVIIGGIQNFILKKVMFLSWWWQGLSVVVVEDSLLAFGGYNGHFNNQVCTFCSLFDCFVFSFKWVPEDV